MHMNRPVLFQIIQAVNHNSKSTFQTDAQMYFKLCDMYKFHVDLYRRIRRL